MVKSNLVRNRPTLNLTVSPEVYAYVKSSGMDISEFFDTSIRSLVWGNMGLPDLPNSSLSEYFRERVDIVDYEEWLRDPRGGKITSTGTVKDYINGVSRLRSIFTPADLYSYYRIPPSSNGKAWNEHTQPNMTHKQSAGLSKFFVYLRYSQRQKVLLGETIDEWISWLSKATTGNGSISNRIIPTTDEVKLGYSAIPDKMQPYYLLLAYSGGRNTHLYQVLCSEDKQVELLGPSGPDKEYHDLEQDILYVDARSVAGGTKMEFAFMFPPELYHAIQEYKPPYASAQACGDVLINTREVLAPGRLVSAKGLRKWHLNTMADSERLSEIELDNIQGRSLGSIQSKHYREMKRKVSKAYARVLDTLREALPIPDYIQSGEFVEPDNRRKFGEKASDYDLLEHFIREGMTNAQILTEFRMRGVILNHNSIGKFVKERGITRKKGVKSQLSN